MPEPEKESTVTDRPPLGNQLGRWLIVVDEGPSKSGITRVWALYPNSKEILAALSRHGVPASRARPIARIGWYAGWRKYALYPERNTLFEQACLRAIVAFLEQKTSEQRATWKAQRT